MTLGIERTLGRVVNVKRWHWKEWTLEIEGIGNREDTGNRENTGNRQDTGNRVGTGKSGQLE